MKTTSLLMLLLLCCMPACAQDMPANNSNHHPTPAATEAAETQEWAKQRLAKSSRHQERSEEHTSELQSLAYLVCRLLLEKKKHTNYASNFTSSPTIITYNSLMMH